MNAREQMQMVAKAVGGGLSEGRAKRRTGPTWDTWEWEGPLGVKMPNGFIVRPDVEDSTAFELLDLLRLGLIRGKGCVGIVKDTYGVLPAVMVWRDYGENSLAATREAIFQAAVAIGKAMP